MMSINATNTYCASICDSATGLYIVAIDLNGNAELGLCEDRMLFTDSNAVETALEKANQSYKACYIFVPEMQS